VDDDWIISLDIEHADLQQCSVGGSDLRK